MPDPTLADVLAAVERLEKRLAVIENHLEPIPRLLTKRRAAQFLGVGKGTLDRLVWSGAIETMSNGGVRTVISLSELECFLRDGSRQTVAQKRRARNARRDPAERIDWDAELAKARKLRI